MIEILKQNGLCKTAGIIQQGNLRLHPSVVAAAIEGSRGPKNCFRDNSDLDVSLVLSPNAAPTAQRCAAVLAHSQTHWHSETELDLAVLFDKNACGLACLAANTTAGLPCDKGVDCIGIYKRSKGFSGFVQGIGLNLEDVFPILYIPIK